MLQKLLPKSLKKKLRESIRVIADDGIRRFDFSHHSQYLPYNNGSKNYVIPKRDEVMFAGQESELPVPPKELWLGYGNEETEYRESGKTDIETMKALLRDTGFEIGVGQRILDLGCGAGRMIRHFYPMAGNCEIWGLDISSNCIFWCQQFLWPLRFATSTTNPHLPFEDQYFDLIYCGSLFTHIDDLAAAWLLELRRVLRKDGRVYLSIHDNATIESLDGPYSDHWLARGMSGRTDYVRNKHSFSSMVFGRGSRSQVFYDRNSFRRMAETCLEVRSFTPNAYAYQTAVVLSRNS